MLSSFDLCAATLRQEIERAASVSPELMSNFIAEACDCLGRPGFAVKAESISRLLELGAWTETALALVDLELPRWKLRRIAYADGAWRCLLSRQGDLPDWLADCVEARHECMPLAILSAMLDARECEEPPVQRPLGTVPRCHLDSEARGETVCCENFA